VAIDTRFVEGEHIVHTHGGRKPTEVRTIAWAKEVEDRGAGEILLTSMDTDGTKNGFALDLTAHISDLLSIPVIASGGAWQHGSLYRGIYLWQGRCSTCSQYISLQRSNDSPSEIILQKQGIAVRK
jgi:cyclase